MTGQELFEAARAEDPDYPWHPWEVLSDDERAGWERKAAEEAPKKKAENPASKPDGKAPAGSK